MSDSGGKKVVFRIADVGFSLEVDSLMEIRQVDDVVIDRSAADMDRGLLGLVSFRDDSIPLWNVRQMFNLTPAVDDSVIILVFGTDGAWAFPIEAVVRVVLPAEFKTCDAPALLQKSDRHLFGSIDIWRNEPLVCFEPGKVEQFMVQA